MYTHVHGGLVLIRYRPERLMSHSYIYIYIYIYIIHDHICTVTENTANPSKFLDKSC
jgi:hypothetical protein